MPADRPSWFLFPATDGGHRPVFGRVLFLPPVTHRLVCHASPAQRKLPACTRVPRNVIHRLLSKTSYRICIIERCHAQYWRIRFRGYITFCQFVIDIHEGRVDLDCKGWRSREYQRGATPMQNPLSLLFGAGPVDYAQLPHGIACPSESVHMYYCIILRITPP